MTSPTRRLAESLDDWSLQGRALITETPTDVVVGGLSVDDARALVDQLVALAWPHSIEDGTGAPVGHHDIEPDLDPYRVKAAKPPVIAGHETVLTNAGLMDWLSRHPAQPVLEVCRLDRAFDTLAVRFAPWGDTQEFVPETLNVDPRSFVKEIGALRKVPGDLSTSILRPSQQIDLENSSTIAWANHAAHSLAISLCNEFEHPNTLLYKGPPIARYQTNDRMASAIDHKGFEALQDCARWVFSLAREAETRHILLTAELSRFRPTSDEASDLLSLAASPALEGAKIAHELGLNKISSDSLKALSDLRKAVSDEAAKLGDSTRQLASAVTGALFGGIGLIAARLTLADDSAVVAGAVLIIGIVLFFYVKSIVSTGRQFVEIQRELREQWRDRLYRFLPEPEYKKMVTEPAEKVEAAFHSAARISMLLAVLQLIAVTAVSAPALWTSYQNWAQTSGTDQSGSGQSSSTEKSNSVSQEAPPKAEYDSHQKQTRPRTQSSRNDREKL